MAHEAIHEIRDQNLENDPSDHLTEFADSVYNDLEKTWSTEADEVVPESSILPPDRDSPVRYVRIRRSLFCKPKY